LSRRIKTHWIIRTIFFTDLVLKLIGDLTQSQSISTPVIIPRQPLTMRIDIVASMRMQRSAILALSLCRKSMDHMSHAIVTPAGIGEDAVMVAQVHF
jgi:hypothetical protein